MKFEITDSIINVENLRSRLQRVDAGGFCSFEGWVRNHHFGKSVLHLEYEAYEPVALKEGNHLIENALNDFDILDARAVHRIGKLMPGELAVWIGVCAAHRAAAFDASRYLIDAIKDTVPVWKHEFYTDGTQVWVDPTECSCSIHEHSK